MPPYTDTVRPSTFSALQSAVEFTKAETLSAEVDNFKQEVDRIQMSKHVLKRENEKLETDRKSLMRQNKRLTFVLQNKRKKYNILSSKHKYLALKASNDRVTKYKKTIGDLQMNVRALQKNVKTLNKNVTEAEREKTDLKQKLEKSRK